MCWKMGCVIAGTRLNNDLDTDIRGSMDSLLPDGESLGDNQGGGDASTGQARSQHNRVHCALWRLCLLSYSGCGRFCIAVSQ